MTTLYLQVEVERVEGKFVGKDELGDALIEGLDTDLYVDESNYEVTDVEVIEWPDPMLSKSERALVCKALEGAKLTAKQQERAKALVARLSDAPKVTIPLTSAPHDHAQMLRDERAAAERDEQQIVGA